MVEEKRVRAGDREAQGAELGGPIAEFRALPRRALDPRRPYKPLDVGEDGLVASLDGAGRLVAITQAHRSVGWAVATPADPMDARRRFDQGAVRRYRASLASPDAASFGLVAAGRDGRVRRPRAWLVHDALPVVALPEGILLVTVVPTATDTGGARGIVQLALGPSASPSHVRWSGRLRLDRAELPELTEVAPLAPLERRPAVRIHDHRLVIEEPALPWAVAVAGDLDRVTGRCTDDGFVEFEAELRRPVRAVVIGLGENGRDALAAAEGLLRIGPAELVARALERWRRRWEGLPADLLVRRGLGYALSCCAAPIDDAVALVTDHRILPLVWPRDGYFVAKALLGWWTRTGLGELREIVRRHLRWLFELAARPEGSWARAHLANGQRKDEVFQLDQQLYPILELAEYVRLTGDREPLDRWSREIERALRAVRARRAAGSPLYATEETAADDPAGVPYLLAGHILLVHVIELLAGLGFDAAAILDEPDAIRRAARAAFTVPGPCGEPVFAYGTDLHGTWLLGHDANDIPLVLAPSWGFCPPSDPVWRATVAVAFSQHNPSFFAGRHGGLGSLHTPGPWPLGHLQARLAARVNKDDAGERAAAAALAAAAYWDGSLPEALDSETGRPISRPWFAWPGALHAALELGRLG